MSVLDYSETAGSNTAISGIDIQGSAAVQNFDNALRTVLADIAAQITRRVAKSTAYTVLKTDHKALIECTAALTLSMTAAATLTNGFMCIVKANGGAVTIDPASSEQIDGATTKTVPDGSFAFVYCNGSAFFTISLPTVLDDIAALTPTDGNFIVGDGTTWVAESGATARASLGLDSMALQASDSVDIDGGAIDGTPIGANSASTGNFTTLTAQALSYSGGNWSTDDAFDSWRVKYSGITLLEMDSSGNIAADGTVSSGNGSASAPGHTFAGDTDTGMYRHNTNELGFATSGTTRAKIDSAGRFLVGDSAYTGTNINDPGVSIQGAGATAPGSYSGTVSGDVCMAVNRTTNDGTLFGFYQAGSLEGSISVSGTTVSYNGGHLSRWFQFEGEEPEKIYKGTVMSNRDEMCLWIDKDGNREENEQLNKLVVSNVPGDVNVAGLYVSDDGDDDLNDHYLAQTGDFIVRIGNGVSVSRGDLLESAGDGTARPQADDVVRASTIAKVTSSTVSATYPDGSYVVPCVVMAC